MPIRLPYEPWLTFDLQGEFDQKGGKRTKWGTKEEYLACIQECKKHGVVVYAGEFDRPHHLASALTLSLSDAVLNHKAGADFAEKFHAIEVDNEDRNKEVSGLYEIEGWTGFNFPGRKGEDGKLKYSEQEYHHYHFTGVDFDNKTGKNAIFKIQGENKDWADDVDGEKGSFDYLMFADLDHSHPDVAKDTINWGEWIVKEADLAGFRFDAIKHYSSVSCCAAFSRLCSNLTSFWRCRASSTTSCARFASAATTRTCSALESSGRMRS